MKKALALIFALGLCSLSSAQDLSQKDRLTAHVTYLASDELNGRQSGSVYAEIAAAYIEDELNGIGLEPFFKSGPEYRFQYNGLSLNDLVYKIEGNDPLLKHEYIVIGAHYDHLGVKQGKIYNGADDNASGTAAIIEIARRLKKEQPALRRSIIISAFDGEEEGLLGSYKLAEALTDSLDAGSIALMLSLDMVGWYSAEGNLKLEGAGTIRGGETMLQEIAQKEGISIQTKHFESSLFTATDTQGFAEKKIPTLAVTTGLKSPYHKPEDDADLIDYEGLDKVCDYISNLVLEVSSSPEFQASGNVAPKHNTSDRIFEIGISGSIGPKYFLFNDSAIRTTRRRFAWNGGIIAQLNLKDLSIQSGLQYESFSCRLPVQEDIFGQGMIYGQKALTVPLTFVKKAGDYVNAFAGFGGYYSRVLEGNFSDPEIDWAIKPSQFGLNFKCGFGLGRFSFYGEIRRGLGVPFSGVNIPKIYLMGCYFSIGYMFF